MITGFTPYRERVIASLNSGYDGSLGDVANVIYYAHKVKRPIITIGNGGSMTTALHFATDLRSIGIPVIDPPSLPEISRLANDGYYEDAFIGYICLFDNPFVIAFSCSGNSDNIVYACQNYDSILFTGMMSSLHWLDAPWLTKPNIVVKVHSTSYEVTEDIHLMMCHALKLMLWDRLKSAVTPVEQGD